LRFAESYAVPGAGTEGKRYWHLLCAAPKLGAQMTEALAAYTGDIPDKAAIEAAIGKGSAKASERALPHVDRAPTSRAKCLACEEALEKGSWRVAVEREVDTGTFVTKGPGYLHPKCAIAFVSETEEGNDNIAEWVRTLFANSGVEQADIAELMELMTPE
jgi:hypothetical protein